MPLPASKRETEKGDTFISFYGADGSSDYMGLAGQRGANDRVSSINHDDLISGGGGATGNKFLRLLRYLKGVFTKTPKAKEKAMELITTPTESAVDASEEMVDVKIKKITGSKGITHTKGATNGPIVFTETERVKAKRKDSANVSNENKKEIQRKTDSIINTYENP